MNVYFTCYLMAVEESWGKEKKKERKEKEKEEKKSLVPTQCSHDHEMKFNRTLYKANDTTSFIV